MDGLKNDCLQTRCQKELDIDGDGFVFDGSDWVGWRFFEIVMMVMVRFIQMQRSSVMVLLQIVEANGMEGNVRFERDIDEDGALLVR